jgi:hypothetical protein
MAANGEMQMNAQATKREGAENDLKQLMADVTRAMEKAQEAVARIAPKAATPITEANQSVRRARTRHHDSLSFGNSTNRSVVMSSGSTSSPAAKSGYRGASSAASKVKSDIAASAGRRSLCADVLQAAAMTGSINTPPPA